MVNVRNRRSLKLTSKTSITLKKTKKNYEKNWNNSKSTNFFIIFIE
jgi:hypothetical protein